MIKIELPDDVAIQLMTQISGQIGRLLSNENAPAPPQHQPRTRSVATPRIVADAIAAFNGRRFTITQAMKKTGLRNGQVGAELAKLAKIGTIKRVEKGVYQA